MIEKLDLIKHTDNLYDKNGFITNVACGGVVISKINEIIDTIYDMQLAISNLDPDSEWYDGNHIADISKKVDLYANQRKWIGYLCWFWDDDYDLKTVGVLEDITTIEEEFHYAKKDTCTVWKHCKPVKPDDSTIYKGGDNE